MPRVQRLEFRGRATSWRETIDLGEDPILTNNIYIFQRFPSNLNRESSSNGDHKIHDEDSLCENEETSHENYIPEKTDESNDYEEVLTNDFFRLNAETNDLLNVYDIVKSTHQIENCHCQSFQLKESDEYNIYEHVSVGGTATGEQQSGGNPPLNLCEINDIHETKIYDESECLWEQINQEEHSDDIVILPEPSVVKPESVIFCNAGSENLSGDDLESSNDDDIRDVLLNEADSDCESYIEALDNLDNLEDLNVNGIPIHKCESESDSYQEVNTDHCNQIPLENNNVNKFSDKNGSQSDVSNSDSYETIEDDEEGIYDYVDFKTPCQINRPPRLYDRIFSDDRSQNIINSSYCIVDNYSGLKLEDLGMRGRHQDEENRNIYGGLDLSMRVTFNLDHERDNGRRNSSDNSSDEDAPYQRRQSKNGERSPKRNNSCVSILSVKKALRWIRTVPTLSSLCTTVLAHNVIIFLHIHSYSHYLLVCISFKVFSVALLFCLNEIDQFTFLHIVMLY